MSYDLTQNPQERLVAILEKMAKEPLAAAAEFEKAGKEMLDMAARLRQAAAMQGGDFCPGGMGDRVKVALVGPNHQIKQFVDVN